MTSEGEPRELVTRGDLSGAFSRDAIDVIMEAQERGARVRVSKRGHAILYGPNGKTSAVPSKFPKNRSKENTVAGMRRLFQ